MVNMNIIQQQELGTYHKIRLNPMQNSTTENKELLLLLFADKNKNKQYPIQQSRS